MLRTVVAACLFLMSLPAASAALTAAPAATDPGEFVPAWAKRAVWYQIFPERFRNGDPGNDPRAGDAAGSYPHDESSPWQVHPWTSDWYELQPWERANGRGLWHNLQRRRYGGDLQGILDSLDYLRDLGINALYLNPVFWSPSLHKYDSATFHHVDPHFGPDPEGDKRLIATETPDDPATWVWTSADRLFLKLLREARARGIRVIIDGVFNHVGLNFWAFRDVQARQRASRFADWFMIRSWDDAAAGTRFASDGWFGVRELPEFREDAAGLYAPGAERYIFDATRRWLAPEGRPEDGIDGWRLDVAFCVSHAFWKRWRAHVKAIKPDAYLVAEIVDTPDFNQPYLQGDEFDAVMNYNFAFAAAEFFVAQRDRLTVSEFDRRLATLRNAYPAGVAHVMQNLFDSHDTARLASHLANPGIGPYRNWSAFYDQSKASNPAWQVRAPRAGERRVQRLFALFQMTYLGAPMIYYGTEAGMWGANDPCPRKPMVWPDRKHAPEATNPDGSLRQPADPVAFDHGLHATYRRLIALRRHHAALQVGDFQTLLTDDARQLYAFARTHGAETVVVALNRGSSAAQVVLPLPAGRWRDALGGPPVVMIAGQAAVELPAESGAVLVRE